LQTKLFLYPDGKLYKIVIQQTNDPDQIFHLNYFHTGANLLAE